MSVITRVGLFALFCLAAPSVAAAASDAMLFRLFLTDGTSVVSFGEFARVDDRVVFSKLIGGDAEPRLYAATLPASAIDWMRTDRHAASTRYQWYAQTRGEEDFLRLSDGVAGVLNEVLQTADRTQALEAAQRVRATLVEWPREHYGYRQQDVREVLSFLDEVISDLRAAAGMTTFDVALVAMTPDIALEPLATLPSLREQVDQALRVASRADRASERVALLQTARLLLDEAGTVIPRADAAALRRLVQTRISEEQIIDFRYGELSRRLMAAATRGAARARISDVESVLNRIPREDARLGGRRPEMVQALQASVQAQVDAARQLLLLRDRWKIRVSLYRDYRRYVGVELLQLVKARPALEAVRRLDGPTLKLLLTLQSRLRGGAERLDRIRPPGDFGTTHGLFVGAWRFAENAANSRYEATSAASVTAAWEASSAAALLLLSRAQQELRELLAPPRLQ